MLATSSSLSLAWTSRARQSIDLLTLDEQLFRLVTDCFGAEREAIQFTRHVISEDGSCEILFTFPGGFLHLTSTHLIVRNTTHNVTTGSVCFPLTTPFIEQIANILVGCEDDQQRCSISDLAASLVYVSFGTPDNEMYIYLSSAFMDGQWFANTVSPRSINLDRPLTVSGFVFGGCFAATHSHLSSSEGLMFMPSSMDPDLCRVVLAPAAGSLQATVIPSLPFDSELGQLICRCSESGVVVNSVEGCCSFGSFGDRFMRMSVTSFDKENVASSLQLFLHARHQKEAQVPECVLLEVIAGEQAVTKTKSVQIQELDLLSIKNVTVEGSGYKICLKHFKHNEAASATTTPTTPPANLNDSSVQNSPVKRSTVGVNNRLPRTACKQVLANLFNQLQNKRPWNTVTSSTTAIPEVQVVHIAKSSEASVVMGLPSVYQEEAAVLRRYINHFRPDRAVMLVNTQKIVEQWQRWKLNLPRVQPYYAVKCNSDLAILQTLANLGARFDCASQGEVDIIVKTLQLNPDRIIYSNPCKQEYGIRHAKQKKVKLSVFDNVDELIKIARIYPDCELLLRIATEDSGSQCPLSCKFGASSNAWISLLNRARELKLNVRGVHFHVGSGCSQLSIFTKALHDARTVFNLGTDRGFNMNILNLGGGFPGVVPDPQSPLSNNIVTFEDLCAEIRPVLDALFPIEDGHTIMAEPGRYFAASSSCLAVKIYSRRKPIGPIDKADSPENFLYYINDGVYGSFNNLIFDHADVIPRILIHSKQATDGERSRKIESVIFGQTCDGFDCVKRKIDLPQLEIGDWLMFEEMGAYTVCAASTFNGFDLPTRLHTCIMPATAPSASSATRIQRYSTAQQRPPLSPCLLGYEQYKQQQQQFLHYKNTQNIPYSRQPLTMLSSPFSSPSIDPMVTAPLIDSTITMTDFDLATTNPEELEQLFLTEASPQRPRLLFRPLSVRPLQSTAQQHTSYPRLGGGKFNPRLVATLLRSAYCRHRLSAPTTISNSSAPTADLIAAVTMESSTATLASQVPESTGVSEHHIPLTTGPALC